MRIAACAACSDALCSIETSISALRFLLWNASHQRAGISSTTTTFREPALFTGSGKKRSTIGGGGEIKSGPTAQPERPVAASPDRTPTATERTGRRLAKGALNDSVTTRRSRKLAACWTRSLVGPGDAV